MKSLRALSALAAVGGLLSSAVTSPAQSSAALIMVHSFTAPDANSHNSDGLGNLGNLVAGLDGNLYGTAPNGGANGQGTIFQLTPAGDFTTLYSFKGLDASPAGTNVGGVQPHPALLLNADGSFTGSTGKGGANGQGTIFRITTDGQFSTLYDFSPANNGTGGPVVTGLTRGTDGNDYGVSSNWVSDAPPSGQSGTYIGSIYRVTPDGTVSIAYQFDSGPQHTLIFFQHDPKYILQGTDGNFYGLTGTEVYDGGTAFQFTPAGAFNVLHTFGMDSSRPNPSLVQGTDGAFYGTTTSGGANGSGAAFRFTSAGEYNVLHSFATFSGPGPHDGSFPVAGVIQGQDGNFYGATNAGGAYKDGTIYQLTPDGVYRTLFSFYGPDGSYPASLLTQAGDGSFCGSTSSGGAYNRGAIFQLTMSTHPAFFSGEAELYSDIYLLPIPGGNSFGYYSYLSDPHYIRHYDLGFEYVFDAADGNAGVYFYDFTSSTFFYTSPAFPFPYLYDFSLGTVLYYYPSPTVADRYNTDGVRYFYRFDTGEIIVK